METDITIKELKSKNLELKNLVEEYKQELDKCRSELAESVREEVELKYTISEMSSYIKTLSNKLEQFKIQEEKFSGN